MTILVLIGRVFVIIWEMFHGRISLNSVAVNEFGEWVQVWIDVYIPHLKYQVKPYSSPWFPASCAAAIVYQNHFFRLHQQNKSSESKVKLRQAGNHWKRVLQAAKFVFVNKPKDSITSQNLGSQDFCLIANSVLNKGKSAISTLLNILAELFNKVPCFPGCWKVLSVVTVFKNVGKRSTAENYCPVSLLSVVSKVLKNL